MLWMFSKNLHVSICIKAPPNWEEQKSYSVSFSEKRLDYMTHHVKYESKVGQGSRRDSPMTQGDGGDPRHRRVSPIRLVNTVIVQNVLENPRITPSH